jgi:CO/xanthine dehydrogenase FAD-binding subunit
VFAIQRLVQPETIEEAYKILTEKKLNTVLGGTCFLRMGSKRIGTAIDLSKLNLDYIKEDEEYIEIGAMATFRDIETSSVLNENFNGVLPKSVESIIGVQFRNIVTVGASIFSKYGFSDLITGFLALDTEVELCGAGRMSLEEFLQAPYKKDLLTRVFIKKNNRLASFKDFRNSVSDFSLVNVAVSKLDNDWKIVVGAKPRGAEIAVNASKKLSEGHIDEEKIEEVVNMAVEELRFGTNMRATKEYRIALSKVLIKRAIMEVLECK